MRGLYPHPPTGQVDVKQLIYMLTVFESTLYTTKMKSLYLQMVVKIRCAD